MESKKAIVRDIALYTVFLVAAVLFHVFVIPGQTIISIAAQADFFSPDTFPKLLAKVIAVFSAIGLVFSLIRYARATKAATEEQQKTEEQEGSFKARAIPFIVIVLILAYILCFDLIGFVPATLIFPPLVLFVIGGRNWKHYLIYYIFAAVMYVLFKYIMLVPLR